MARSVPARLDFPADNDMRPVTPSGTFEALRSFTRRDGAGVGASVLLHALIALIVLLLARRTLPPQPVLQQFVPVSLVAQSEGPDLEPHQARAMGAPSDIPQILPRARLTRHTPSAVAPQRTTEPIDELEEKLEALSKLRQPNTDPRLLGNAGTSPLAESGNDDSAGGQGNYNTRDIIRAQILRRWSLDRERLGNRDFDILIRVLIKHDGTVLEADIVDTQRAKTDSVFRWIAQSARNAVILSSPLTLPPGLERGNLQLTVRLNPRDTLE